MLEYTCINFTFKVTRGCDPSILIIWFFEKRKLFWFFKTTVRTIFSSKLHTFLKFSPTSQHPCTVWKIKLFMTKKWWWLSRLIMVDGHIFEKFVTIVIPCLCRLVSLFYLNLLKSILKIKTSAWNKLQFNSILREIYFT